MNSYKQGVLFGFPLTTEQLEVTALEGQLPYCYPIKTTPKRLSQPSRWSQLKPCTNPKNQQRRKLFLALAKAHWWMDSYLSPLCRCCPQLNLHRSAGQWSRLWRTIFQTQRRIAECHQSWQTRSCDRLSSVEIWGRRLCQLETGRRARTGLLIISRFLSRTRAIKPSWMCIDIKCRDMMF